MLGSDSRARLPGATARSLSVLGAIAVALLAALALAGCSGESDGSSATEATMQSSEALEVIDIDELSDRRESLPQLQVVDVRTDQEWASGTIPGAIHIPHDEIEAGRTDGIDLARPIAVICRSGSRATIAGEALVRAGAAEVQVVRPGGVGTWGDAGYPLVIP